MKPSVGRDENEQHGLAHAGPDQRIRPHLGQGRADQPADQRMGRAGGNAVVPGDDVPGNGADQRTEHDVVVDDGRIDGALADGRRHLELEDENRDDVEEGRPRHRLVRLEHAGGDDGGDRVGGIVEAVHEIEHQCQTDQQHHDPQADFESRHAVSAGPPQGDGESPNRKPQSG